MSKLSAVCSICRYHLQVIVNYNTGGNAFALAKMAEHMHHFVYKSGRQQGSRMAEEVTEKGQVVETYHYQCSHLSCSAMVSLRILSPLITPQFLELLSDPAVIRERAEGAIAAQPERLEGMAVPAPVTVIDNLRLYLYNALHSPERSKEISSSNKRFMLSFGLEGTACGDLLEFLGFVYDAVRASHLRLSFLGLPLSLTHSFRRIMVTGNHRAQTPKQYSPTRTSSGSSSTT